MLNHEIIGRHEAHALGRKHFFSGQPCKRGHLTLRYTSNGACIECQNLRTPSAIREVIPLHAGERMFFGNCPGPVVDAAEALLAFRYMEMAGWHEMAVAALRANPELADKIKGTREEFDVINRAYITARMAAKAELPASG